MQERYDSYQLRTEINELGQKLRLRDKQLARVQRTVKGLVKALDRVYQVADQLQHYCNGEPEKD